MRVTSRLWKSALPVAATLLLLATARASERPQAPVPSADGFVKRYGAGWRIVNDEVTGAPAFVYGKQFAPAYTARSLADYETTARFVVDENVDLLGVDSNALDSAQVKYLNLSGAGTSDKIVVSF